MSIMESGPISEQRVLQELANLAHGQRALDVRSILLMFTKA